MAEGGASLEVAGHLPLRADPSRSADRASPNAGPLFQEGERLREARHGERLQAPLAMNVTYGVELPRTDGYSWMDPVIEVLVDAGLLKDERDVVQETSEFDDGIDGFRVTLMSVPE
jgi:hypothetical protein